MTWAERASLISKVPLPLEGLGSTRDDREPITLEPSEVERLLNAADPTLRAVVALAAFGGLRRGEVLTLRRRDVDLDAALVRIVAKPLDDGEEWRPKSKQCRSVPMCPRLAAELGSYLADPTVGELAPDQWLFQRQTDGGRLRTIEDRLRRLYGRAGVRRVRGSLMHILRRTWATRLAAAGVNAEHLRRLGGWSSLAVVQNSYLGRIPDVALREAVSLLG